MTALVVTRPDMPGFNPSDMDDAHTPSSDFSFYQAAMPNPGMSFFASQTGPSSDLNGSLWDTTGEGSQNFHDFSETGSAHHGESDDLTYTLDGHITPRPQESTHSLEDTQTQWNAVAAATSVTAPIGGEPMRRGTSSGSQKHRVLKASSPKGRPRHSSSLSRTSSQMSHMDLTGNTSAYVDRAVAASQIMDVNSCFLDQEPIAIPPQMFFSNLPMDLGMDDGLSLSTDMTLHVSPALHVSPGQMQLEPEASLAAYSPSTSLSSSFSPTGSSAGSPEGWLMSSPPNSDGGSPIILGQSSRNDRKLDGTELIEDDLSGSTLTIMPEEFPEISLPPSFTTRRPTNEGDTAREHHLYKNATPQADGLFHCPWEGTPTCNHKPEKLKCNYDKFVDSHLKPYRCKIDSCEAARFSSTACLLRHEREAHAMHGHGDKPFRCTHEGCDRSLPGNGFPRQWNLKDHMRRVHNDNGAPGSPVAIAGPHAAQPSKSRKRKDAPKVPGTTGNRKTVAKASQVMEAVKEELSSKPLIDEWMSQHKALEEILQSLVRPQDVGNAARIKAAHACLATMDKISNGLKPSLQDDSIPSTYGYVPAG